MNGRRLGILDGALVLSALAAIEFQLGGRWPEPLVALAASTWIAGLLARHRLRLAPLAGPLALAAAARLDPAWIPRFVLFFSIVLAGWLLGWSGSRSSRTGLWADLGALLTATLLAVVAIAGRPLVDAAYLGLFGAAALLLGRLAAGQQARVGVERRRLETAEEERATYVRRAAAQARASMAAELHDVIGQSVGAMALQAGAARVKLEAGDVGATRDALLAVETAGHAALVDLRRMLGVLRRDMAEPS